MSAQEHPIVIVGSGPAGISTWLHLHDRDPALAARSVVIEQATHPREKLCGGGLTWSGDRQLGFLGVSIEVPAVPVHEVEFRFASETLRLPGDDVMRVVRRWDFDRALVGAALDRGLVLHEDVRLDAVDPSGNGVTLQTSRCTYRCRVVVGADGASSTVRARSGFERGGALSRLIKVVTPPSGADSDATAAHRAVFDFRPIAAGLQGYVWHFSCLEAGRPSVDRGIFDSRVRPELPRADLRAILAAELAGAGVSSSPTAWRSHPVRPFTPDAALVRPHVVLAGDAAGIDPVLGEGLSQSLRHGDVAADAIVDAFERDDFSMKSHAELFARHELGRSLLLRHHLAAELYGEAARDPAEACRRFRAWLAAGLP